MKANEKPAILSDYLLNQEGNDWPTLLAGWCDELPPDFTLWMVNRLGDLVLVLADGSVHFFDAGGGTLERIADSREHFATIIDEGNNANLWLAMPLVDACVSAGMHLKDGQCYGFKVPPVLGGGYTLENLVPTDLAVH